MTLVEFLLARIGEDEARARAEVIELGPGDQPDDFPDGWLTFDKLEGDAGLYETTARFIMNWSPRRVLAECEAKRRIVTSAVDAEGAGEQALQTAEEWRAQALEDVLELLALPWSDHMDYNPEWRPL